MSSIPTVNFNIEGARPITIERLIEPPSKKGTPLIVQFMKYLSAESFLGLKSTCRAFYLAMDRHECRTVTNVYKFTIIPTFFQGLIQLCNHPIFLLKLASFVPVQRERLIKQAVVGFGMMPQINVSTDTKVSLGILEKAVVHAEKLVSPYCDLALIKLRQLALQIDPQKAYEIAKKIQDPQSKILALFPIAEFLMKMEGYLTLKDYSKLGFIFSQEEGLSHTPNSLIHEILSEIVKLLKSIADSVMEMRYHDLIIRYIDPSTAQSKNFLKLLVVHILLAENSPEKDTLMMNLSYKIENLEQSKKIIKKISDPRKKISALHKLSKQIAKDHPVEANKLKVDAELLEKCSHLFPASQDSVKEKEIGNSPDSVLEQFFTMPLKNLVDMYVQNEASIRQSLNR